jgi:hypothetical protein
MDYSMQENPFCHALTLFHPGSLKVKKHSSTMVVLGKTFMARSGGRGATLEISPAPRAGCWF